MADNCIQCGYDISLSNGDKCRQCEQPGRSYVSPDAAEQNPVALNHAEMESRERVLQGKPRRD